MKQLSILLSAILISGCSQLVAEDTQGRDPSGAESLEFLSGSWGSEHGGEWSEEYWSHARANTMIGYGRSGREDDLNSYEFLRIVTREDGSVVYIAAPGGGEATQFALLRSTQSSAIFENGEHDFPQRISYSREGDTLNVEISLIDGSQAIGWSLQRAN